MKTIGPTRARALFDEIQAKFTAERNARAQLPRIPFRTEPLTGECRMRLPDRVRDLVEIFRRNGER